MIYGVSRSADLWRLAGKWGAPLDVEGKRSRAKEVAEGVEVRRELERPEIGQVERVERVVRMGLCVHQLEEDVVRENRELRERVRRLEGRGVYGEGR